jgi:hypothetical protein
VPGRDMVHGNLYKNLFLDVSHTFDQSHVSMYL